MSIFCRIIYIINNDRKYIFIKLIQLLNLNNKLQKKKKKFNSNFILECDFKLFSVTIQYFVNINLIFH